jgi:hypothetical protein
MQELVTLATGEGGIGPGFVPAVVCVFILLSYAYYRSQIDDGDIGNVNRPNHPDRRSGKGRRKK